MSQSNFQLVDLKTVAEKLPNLKQLALNLENIPVTYENTYIEFRQMLAGFFIGSEPPDDDAMWSVLICLRDLVESDILIADALNQLTSNNKRARLACNLLECLISDS